MTEPRDTVSINVEYNTEDEEYGPVYVASCDDLMFTTDGRSFEELLQNIRECLILNLKDTDSIAEFGVAPDAHIQIVMVLPDNYAETA